MPEDFVREWASAHSDTLTIANGQTTTGTGGTGNAGVFDGRMFRYFGVVIPAAFTGTSISFLVADSPTATFQPLYDSGNVPYSIPVTQGRSYALPDSLAVFRYFQIVSNASEGGARSLLVTASS